MGIGERSCSQNDTLAFLEAWTVAKWDRKRYIGTIALPRWTSHARHDTDLSVPWNRKQKEDEKLGKYPSRRREKARPVDLVKSMSMVTYTSPIRLTSTALNRVRKPNERL